MMPTETCDHCGTRPARTKLDGDDLCQKCADAWCRAEGEALAQDLRSEMIHRGI